MADNDRDSSPSSALASRPASDSSRDARALVSGRDILDALKGIERELSHVDRRLASVESMLTGMNTRAGFMKAEQELIGLRVGAMRAENTAALSRIEAATRAIDASADEAAEAADEVKAEAKKLRETGEHLVPKLPEEFDRFEITAKGVRFSATWLRIAAAVKAVPLVGWIFAGLAAVAGAAWAWLAHKI